MKCIILNKCFSQFSFIVLGLLVNIIEITSKYGILLNNTKILKLWETFWNMLICIILFLKKYT